MASQKTHRVLQVHDFKQPLKCTEVPFPTINANQVLIKQIFCPINPSNIMATTGKYYGTKDQPLPFTIGGEGSGEVVEVGKELESKFKPGDRVAFLAKWSEYVVADEKTCFKLPDEISLELGACMYVNPLTVFAMLEQLKVEGHKSVVHTAGSSALGRMLIQVMKENGIKTVNLVRNNKYIQELKDAGADYVLDTTNENFDKEFKEVVQSLDCKKCYDAIGGKFVNRIGWLLPKGSKITVYGALEEDETVHIDFWALLANQVSVDGFWLVNEFQTLGSEKISQGFKSVFSGLQGSYGSKISKVFAFEEIKEAIKYWEEHASEGKVLLTSQSSQSKQ